MTSLESGISNIEVSMEATLDRREAEDGDEARHRRLRRLARGHVRDDPVLVSARSAQSSGEVHQPPPSKKISQLSLNRLLRGSLVVCPTLDDLNALERVARRSRRTWVREGEG